jgi:pimeloyl-ACP methyl ester carboxylesterase
MKPAVILLHCSGSSARQWERLSRRLDGHCAVHAIDLHGHGARAAWSGDGRYTLDDEAALVLPLLERSGGAHLVGHSYGGAVALHVATRRPDLVHSVAVFEPVLFGLLAEPAQAHGSAAREAAGIADTLRAEVARGATDDAAERFVDYWSGAGAWRAMSPQSQRSMAARMPTVLRHFDALSGAPAAGALERLAMPLLCMSGSRSTAAALRIAELLCERLPRAVHRTLVGVGHMGPITHADWFNQYVASFLGIAAHHGQQPASRWAVA